MIRAVFNAVWPAEEQSVADLASSKESKPETGNSIPQTPPFSTSSSNSSTTTSTSWRIELDEFNEGLSQAYIAAAEGDIFTAATEFRDLEAYIKITKSSGILLTSDEHRGGRGGGGGGGGDGEVDYLFQNTSGGGSGSNSNNTSHQRCPRCGRRVTSSMILHTRTCPITASHMNETISETTSASTIMKPLVEINESETSSVSTVPTPPTTSPSQPQEHDDPRLEMLESLRTRLLQLLHIKLQQAQADEHRTNDVRELWCIAASILHDDSANSVFAMVVNRHFRVFASQILEKFERICKEKERRRQVEQQYYNAAYENNGVIQEGGGRRNPTSSTAHHGGGFDDDQPQVFHVYLRDHFLTIADAVGVSGLTIPDTDIHTTQIQESAINEIESSNDNNTENTDAASTTTTPSSSSSVTMTAEALETLAAVLGEATVWMARITEQPVPHSARCEIAAKLHAEAVAAAVPVLQAYRIDTQIDWTLCVARTLLDFAEGRLSPSEMSTFDAWLRTLHALSALHTRRKTGSLTSDKNSRRMEEIPSNGSGGDTEEQQQQQQKQQQQQQQQEEEEKEGKEMSISSSKTSSRRTMHHSYIDTVYPLSTSSISSGCSNDPVLLIRFKNPTITQTARQKRRQQTPLEQIQQSQVPVHHHASPSSSSSLQPPAATLPPPPLPLPIPLLGAVAVVDEACDQLSFVCNVLERYLRCATVALGLGGSDTPSRTDDAVAIAMHSFQGEYVLLERAYLENAVTRAAMSSSASSLTLSSSSATPARSTALALDGGNKSSSVPLLSSTTSTSSSSFTSPTAVEVAQFEETANGWIAVAMGEEPHILSFGWVDSVFFILSKAVARSCATYCDMAAAAAINFVAGCLDGAVRNVCKECIDMCAESRPDTAPGRDIATKLGVKYLALSQSHTNNHHQRYLSGRSAGGRGGGMTLSSSSSSSTITRVSSSSQRDGNDAEAELARQLQAALLGNNAGKTDIEKEKKNGGEKENDTHDDNENNNDDDEALKMTYEPAASERAIHACNTVGTAAAFARSLYDRTCGEAETVFPAPYDATPPNNAPSTAGSKKSQALLSPSSRGIHHHHQQNLIWNAATCPKLRIPGCHMYLKGPIESLGTVATGFHILAEEAAQVLAYTLCGAGFEAMRNVLLASSAAFSLSSASQNKRVPKKNEMGSFGSTGGVKGLAASHHHFSSSLYVLTAEEYDNLTSTSTTSSSSSSSSASSSSSPSSSSSSAGSQATHTSADPLLSAFHLGVLVTSGLSSALSRLHQPEGADAVLRQVSIAAANVLDEYWIQSLPPPNNGFLPTTSTTAGGGVDNTTTNAFTGGPSMNEYGALLFASQLRHLESKLAALTRGTYAASHIRRVFSKLLQASSILGLDALSDLYHVSFPTPGLSKREVMKLVHQRIGLIKSAASFEAIQWDKVKCTID